MAERLKPLITNPITNRTTNRKKRMRAISTAPAAIPPKPKAAATIAKIKKISVHRNILKVPCSHSGERINRPIDPQTLVSKRCAVMTYAIDNRVSISTKWNNVCGCSISVRSEISVQSGVDPSIQLNRRNLRFPRKRRECDSKSSTRWL